MGANPSDHARYAFLSDGKLHFAGSNGELTTHESRFAKDAQARVERNLAANGWKGESDAWNMQNAMVPGLASFQSAGSGQPAPRFTGVAAGLPGHVCYSMDVYGAGGLFTFDLEKRCETRLMHRNEFNPSGLTANRTDGKLAFSLPMGDVTAHLKVKDLDGPRQKQITDGDTCDECPWWHVDEETTYLYFHSTPIGRNEQGYAMGRGPGQICRIGIDQGDVETLLGDDQYDYLHPRVDSGGNLFAIRRNYRNPAVRNAPSTWETVKDILLLPYRIIRMLFYIANFMSMMSVGKPLTSEMMQQTPEMQAQQRVIWGRALQTQKQIRKGGQANRMRLVPDDWELMRVSANGTQTSIAKHVMAFDVTDQGHIVYSDGGGVYEINADGEESQLCKLTGVTMITTLKPSANAK